MSDFVGTIVTVLAAIVGLAIIAVLLSNHSDTSNVVTAAGSAFQSLVGKAVSPVSN